MRAQLKIDYLPYSLLFKKPARTSRSVMYDHRVWFVIIRDLTDPDHIGIGECAPLPGLSCDDVPDYESQLKASCLKCEATGLIDYKALRNYPSILFGLETAFLHFNQRNPALFRTTFSAGQTCLPINGLIWMGPLEDMMVQVKHKIKQGFTCLKLKIGALGFEREIEMLRAIRDQYPADQLTLRVDANGAFSPTDAAEKLKQLATLSIHSIEQPVKAGQWTVLKRLIEKAPLPIALDEELIGVNDDDEKKHLLDTLKPQYLVLKPSLHGGFRGCETWIRLAEERGIGWWITSALESAVGLNAIAQWTATLDPKGYQGLGTGQLYVNNLESPLCLKGEELWFNSGNNDTPSNACFNRETVKTIEQNIDLYTAYTTNTADQQFICNNTVVNQQTYRTVLAQSEQQRPLIAFLDEWFNNSDTITIQTSGSTGFVKPIRVAKRLLIQSACLTCHTFGLKPGDRCLLCLSLDYIAGKMMVIRALVGGLTLDVTEPTGSPLSTAPNNYKFTAMVPLQVYHTLQETRGLEKLEQTEILLIGGSSISKSLETSLQACQNEIYCSYGMAETLSHVALRRVNGDNASDYYTPLPFVAPHLDEEDCLVIEAPLVTASPVYTKDIASLLPDGRFKILGRKDNLIITGGRKILAETLEDLISSFVMEPFAITSRPDDQFGEIIVLVSEKPLEKSLFENIAEPWKRPKQLIVNPIPRTRNGKVDRVALKSLVVS